MRRPKRRGECQFVSIDYIRQLWDVDHHYHLYIDCCPLVCISTIVKVPILSIDYIVHFFESFLHVFMFYLLPLPFNVKITIKIEMAGTVNFVFPHTLHLQQMPAPLRNPAFSFCATTFYPSYVNVFVYAGPGTLPQQCFDWLCNFFASSMFHGLFRMKIELQPMFTITHWCKIMELRLSASVNRAVNRYDVILLHHCFQTFTRRVIYSFIRTHPGVSCGYLMHISDHTNG